MNISKSILTALMAVFLCLPFAGCQHIQAGFETLGNYVNDNKSFVSFTARQITHEYINRKDTEEGRIERAKDLDRRVSNYLNYLEGSPTATVDTLMAVIDESIEWEKLDNRDRRLVKELVTLVEYELKAYEAKNPTEKGASIAIRFMMDAALTAARTYLIGV